MRYSRCKWEFQRLSNTQPTNNTRSKRKWDPNLVSLTHDHPVTETNNMLIHRNILLIEMEFRIYTQLGLKSYNLQVLSTVFSDYEPVVALAQIKEESAMNIQRMYITDYLKRLDIKRSVC